MPGVRALVAIGVMLVGGTLVAGAAQARDRGCVVPNLGLPLAGPGAVDCGVAQTGKSHARRRVVACARKALAAGKPVRFGMVDNYADEFFCDVVVADAERRFWVIQFHWATSILAYEDPSAFVGRCPTIDLDWESPKGTDEFGPRGCVFDPDAFERAQIRIP